MLETRPSKKQQELFEFIDSFIKNHGYGPSYREIMRALDYKSVSTVAVHVDGLITRGLLQKKDNSARSLEVVRNVSFGSENHLVWLQKEIKKRQELKTKIADEEAMILEKAFNVLDSSHKINDES